MYIYISLSTCMCIYIYMYRERERERDRCTAWWAAPGCRAPRAPGRRSCPRLTSLSSSFMLLYVCIIVRIMFFVL